MLFEFFKTMFFAGDVVLLSVASSQTGSLAKHEILNMTGEHVHVLRKGYVSRHALQVDDIGGSDGSNK